MGAEGRVLMGEMERGRGVLQTITERLRRFREEELPSLGRTEISAVFLARLAANYYTALETLFLRISQYFENSLVSDRWHTDLLDKMCLKVAGVRDAVVAGETAALLREVLRFRHFERYYFELEHDWKKLDYVVDVLDRLHPLLVRDLDRFGDFLKRLDVKDT